MAIQRPPAFEFWINNRSPFQFDRGCEQIHRRVRKTADFQTCYRTSLLLVHVQPILVIPHSFQESFFSGNHQTPRGNKRFLKRTMVEKNGESTPSIHFPTVPSKPLAKRHKVGRVRGQPKPTGGFHQIRDLRLQLQSHLPRFK